MSRGILIVIVVVIVGLVFLLLSGAKNAILYHPGKVTSSTYDNFIQKLKLKSEPGEVKHLYLDGRLDGILMKNPVHQKCILYCHGNAGNIATNYQTILMWYNYASVCIFDYGSYGKSKGSKWSLTEKNLKEDAKIFWNHLVCKMGYAPDDIIVIGESLGCSVAACLVKELCANCIYPNHLILISPWYSLTSLIRAKYQSLLSFSMWGIILDLFYGVEYTTDKYLQQIPEQTGIIVAHSTDDEVIPFYQGITLYQDTLSAHPKNIHFYALRGSHNDLVYSNDFANGMLSIFKEDEQI